MTENEQSNGKDGNAESTAKLSEELKKINESIKKLEDKKDKGLEMGVVDWLLLILGVALGLLLQAVYDYVGSLHVSPITLLGVGFLLFVLLVLTAGAILIVYFEKRLVKARAKTK